MSEHILPPKHAAAFAVVAGKEFAVVDVDGGQVADLTAFVAEPSSGNVPATGDATSWTATDERFAAKYTLASHERLRLSTEDTLVTTAGRPLLTVIDDDCGVHDLLYGPCTEWVREGLYGSGAGAGCREHLADVLSEYDVDPAAVYDVFNVFMQTTVTDQTNVHIKEPVSVAGDRVVFRSDRDVIVGVSACPGESVANTGEPTAIGLDLPAGTALTGPRSHHRASGV